MVTLGQEMRQAKKTPASPRPAFPAVHLQPSFLTSAEIPRVQESSRKLHAGEMKTGYPKSS